MHTQLFLRQLVLGFERVLAVPRAKRLAVRCLRKNGSTRVWEAYQHIKRMLVDSELTCDQFAGILTDLGYIITDSEYGQVFDGHIVYES